MADDAPNVLRPSLLDQLIDEEPDRSHERSKHPNQVMREIKQAVRRDLEDLLNSRWRCMSWPPELEQLDDSLINYGLPDFSKVRDPRDHDELCGIIRTTVERFEPRLERVRVEPLSDPDAVDRTMQFRIDAVLKVEPMSDKVAFNSVLEPTTGNFRVERAAQ